MIYADTRWKGSYGIARYAGEVISRLSVPWLPFDSDRTPSSPRALLDGRRVPADASLFYSPAYASVASRVPQLLTVHDLIHLEPSTPGRLKYLAYYDAVLRPRILKAGMVLTVSETSAVRLRKWLGTGRVEVINTGNGCSPAFVPAGPVFEAPRPYFLYVGNSRKHKNAGVILRAMAQLPDLDLHVVSGDTAEFERLFAETGIRNRARVHTGLSDEQLARLYRGAVATLLPSTVEGFGLPAVESLCCGTPVVYWQGCDSVREIVQQDGVPVADATNPDKWSVVLRGIIDGKPIQPKIDRSKFSWDRVAAAVSDVLIDYGR